MSPSIHLDASKNQDARYVDRAPVDKPMDINLNINSISRPADSPRSDIKVLDLQTLSSEPPGMECSNWLRQ
jgi:hypothetical protein